MGVQPDKKKKSTELGLSEAKRAASPVGRTVPVTGTPTPALHTRSHLWGSSAS